MRRPKSFQRFIAALLTAVLCSAVALATPAAAAEATRRALLIGINDYQAVNGLLGAVNDVNAMREVLLSVGGFKAENIRVLTDRAATRAGILGALNQLVREAGPDDVVYVHYSGHGSQVQDVSGDEPDGLDETLVPQDGRTKGIADIRDDELDAIFARLRTSTALIVLDSCHSGTATRSLDIRARSVPPDTRLELYEEPVTRTRAIVPRVQSRYIVMSGAAAEQEALDGPIDEQYRGFFSYALSRTLASTGLTATPRAVFAGVGRELQRIQTRFARNAMPEPQLEGPASALTAPLFAASGTGRQAPPRIASVEVRNLGQGQVLLINGVLLGAAPGSVWSIYAAGESGFAPGAATAIATATQIEGNHARARLAMPATTVAAGSRAVLGMPAPAAARFSIRLNEMSPQRRQTVESVLKRAIPDVQIAGPADSARFLIDVRGDQLQLLTADGMQVVQSFDAQTDQWGAAVARILTRNTNSAALLTLDNPASRLTLNVQMAGGASPARRDVILASVQPAALHIRHPGEPRTTRNSLQLLISADSAVYLTIVDIDSEGNANLLFPNGAQRPDFHPAGRIQAHQPVLIPDSLETGNRAGFFWDYGPPAGIDTVRVFASTDLRTASLIRERFAGSAAPLAARGLSALGSSLAGLAVRGIATVADSRNEAAPALAEAAPDWTAASITVAVED